MPRVISYYKRLEQKAHCTGARIQAVLNTNAQAVERALIILLGRQTTVERKEKKTKYHNSRGFSQADAEFMTRMAEHVLAGKRLSYSELCTLRSPWSRKAKSTRIGKYHRQLLEAAVEKRERIQATMRDYG